MGPNGPTVQKNPTRLNGVDTSGHLHQQLKPIKTRMMSGIIKCVTLHIVTHSHECHTNGLDVDTIKDESNCKASQLVNEVLVNQTLGC
jgi:hypothetical protein